MIWVTRTFTVSSHRRWIHLSWMLPRTIAFEWRSTLRITWAQTHVSGLAWQGFASGGLQAECDPEWMSQQLTLQLMFAAGPLLALHPGYKCACISQFFTGFCLVRRQCVYSGWDAAGGPQLAFLSERYVHRASGLPMFLLQKALLIWMKHLSFFLWLCPVPPKVK